MTGDARNHRSVRDEVWRGDQADALSWSTAALASFATALICMLTGAWVTGFITSAVVAVIALVHLWRARDGDDS